MQLRHVFAMFILAFGFNQPAIAQSVQPTAEQMRMINSLPPAQRQQALSALRQMQSQGGSTTTQGSITEPLSTPQTESPNVQFIDMPEPELRAKSDSRVIVNLTPKSTLTNRQRSELDEDPVLSKIQGSNFYQLDSSGVLHIPGLVEIPLLGLDDEAIEQRLGAEASLADFEISAFILDSQPIGAEALKPFGYDIFEPDTIGFDPVAAGPVPPDYVLGPGDSIRVQLFGNVNGIYEFEVSRDGVLNLPELGPITVAGLPFSEFRNDLNKRVQEMLIGTQVSVTMGQLRTIRVFVLGDANRPGSYVVNSLATISSALHRSGGISEIGTLRNIQLKRQGNVVARLDLYDLLLNGDTSNDLRLQPGDVIFVPPIGDTISMAGAVRRPAIYEAKGKTTVAEAIRLAGGMAPDAYPGGARIERIEAGQQRNVLSIDVGDAAAANAVIRAGDVLFIPRLLPEFEDTVTLAGHVQRPGPYQWREGMRLTQLIGSLLELKPDADTDYVLVRREDPATRRVSVLSANLATAFSQPSSTENIALMPRDTVYVFSLALGRQRVIEPIMDELQLQASHGAPFQLVSVTGQVKAPGNYPLEPGMRVSDLMRAGGNLSEQAYALNAELARYSIVDGEFRNTEVVDVNLQAILLGDSTADLVLQEHDNLRISTVPEWDSLWTVTIEGEVRFPGTYRVRRGETLRQVLERAGGLTDFAFAEGAIFLRESLRQKEQQQIDDMARRMEAELTSMSLESIDTTGTEALSVGRQLLVQLQSVEPMGRLVIDLEQLTARSKGRPVTGDVELRDNDRLLIPKRAQEVTVIGETQQNASHLFTAGLTRDDYIDMSGGLTRRADKRLIYVVRASGAVVAGNRSRWFGRGDQQEMRPGDTIVVPLETDRMRPLTFWGGVTQILYQSAIAVAAVKTFDN